jgi:DNA-binding HxlR family transcriptional regulator/putative sterol carrier protein
MRSYGQYCGVARALDLIGDRWTLLIVRELMIRDGCRYTDLRNGLPGIATNLLAERLRELEQSGLVWREDAPPPVATTLFHLTARGQALEPVLRELGRWGAPLLAEQGRNEDAALSHWLVLPLRLYFRDTAPEKPPVRLELRGGGEAVTVETVDGKVATRVGAAAHPDAVLSGTPQLILAVLAGKLGLKEARAAGLKCEGNEAAVGRIRPVSAAIAA